MTREQTLFFDLPALRRAVLHQVEEFDKDIHTGEIYHCGSCGIQVIFAGGLPPRTTCRPPRARRDCHFCQPEPCRFGPSTRRTKDTEKGEKT